MSKRLITVGHSPDPDDAFMFYALAHDKIDTGDLQFRHELMDIETLNRRALRGELEVSAVSLHAYAHLLDKYALLPTGCSMGDRYGPMVVARRPMKPAELLNIPIAVPGTLLVTSRSPIAIAPSLASALTFTRPVVAIFSFPAAPMPRIRPGHDDTTPATVVSYGRMDGIT